MYNNITGPERLALRCSLHFIHKGVKPLWEDPANEHGGAWNFRTAKADTAVVWRELLMALIGEQFEDTIDKGNLTLQNFSFQQDHSGLRMLLAFF